MSTTETETVTHPAACPYCKGTIVNVAQPDYLLRDAVLNDDGSITIAENTDASDFEGLTLLVCHTCGSVYPQPVSVVERFDDSLKADYARSPIKGEPGYIGNEIIWLPLTPGQISVLSEALDSHIYWQLGDNLPKNDGQVFLPGDEGGDRYWSDDAADVAEHAEAIDQVAEARRLDVFLFEERERQLAHKPNFTRAAD